jgi:hypothetical protein
VTSGVQKIASYQFTDVIAELQKAPQIQRTDKLNEGIADRCSNPAHATATFRSGTRHRQASVGKGLSPATRVNASLIGIRKTPGGSSPGFFRLLVTFEHHYSVTSW